jgi:hypothetical protein
VEEGEVETEEKEGIKNHQSKTPGFVPKCDVRQKDSLVASVDRRWLSFAPRGFATI